MKKALSMILALVICLSLCACGGNTNPTTGEVTPTATLPTSPAINATEPPTIPGMPEDNTTETKQYEAIEITAENWTEYFDLDSAYFDYRWHENAFGEAEGFWHANLYVPLKEEYKDKLVATGEKIAYEVQYDGGDLKTQIDLTNRTIELLEDWENIKETGEQFSVVQEADDSQLHYTGLEIGCWEVAQYNINGTTWFRVMNQMLRIKGTLYFTQE